jgi:hypothetical protein
MKTNPSQRKEASEIIKNQFRWRFKSIGNQWTDWKITQEYGYGPQSIVLSEEPQSGVISFILLIKSGEEYSAKMTWNGNPSNENYKNGYSTSQAIINTGGTNKNIFILEVQRIFEDPGQIVKNKFKWHYKSIGNNWSDWMSTPAYGAGPQTIILDRLTQSGILGFNIEIKSNEEYSAEITWGGKVSPTDFVNDFFTSNTSLDTGGTHPDNFILEVQRIKQK